MSGKFLDSWIAWRENLNTKLNKYNPVPKTEDMTVPVGIDDEGKLWCENDPDKDIPYIKFSSSNPFTLKTNSGGKIWTPTTALIEYSYDKETWTNWGGSLINSGPKNVLYLRGSNATAFGMGTSTSSTHKRLILNGENIKISGDIEGLLSHGSRIDGEFPNVTNGTFRYLFEDCTALVDASNLKFKRTSLPKQYMESMFRNDTNLRYPPRVIEATTIGVESCAYSFCASGIVRTPKFKALSVANKGFCGTFQDSHELLTAEDFDVTETTGEQAFNYTFWRCIKLQRTPRMSTITKVTGQYTFRAIFCQCTELKTVAKFNVLNLPSSTFRVAYYQSPLIKISETRTGEYINPYRIPSVGTATETGTETTYGMFSSTGGTFTDDPVINTTYYTSNEVVG